MTAILNVLCLMAVVIEISASKWIVASATNIQKKTRRKSLEHAGSRDRFEALLAEITAAVKALKVPEGTRVLVGYEAGQEGFWLVRELLSRGIEAVVIDPVSLQVDRKSRRVKTDRVDAEALVAAQLRYMAGECRALRMLRIPSEAEEDSREWQRERDRLEGERRGCSDRITKKLRTQGIWPLPKTWRDDLRAGTLRCMSGRPVGAMLASMMVLELERLERAEAMLKDLNDKLELLDPQACERIKDLSMMRSIGLKSARALSTLLFWRRFDNRRQVGSSVGLVGTPYDSGTMRQDQGISKSGDPKLRALLVELSWLWLRYQPKSAISLWFKRRTEGGGKRNKRVMIVAVARKLVIALWRYLEQGVIPEGASLKKQVA
jgi:transposase